VGTGRGRHSHFISRSLTCHAHGAAGALRLEPLQAPRSTVPASVRQAHARSHRSVHQAPHPMSAHGGGTQRPRQLDRCRSLDNGTSDRRRGRGLVGAWCGTSADDPLATSSSNSPPRSSRWMTAVELAEMLWLVRSA